ncbi:GNAT family N-acetyltransferase [Allorhizocola rhizosphaerae]|uniref:GNAT family N-acetyltransferase n=1 Tax=Allorhizocola rhizosphaerae TaxID=1872709 RepID=UPI0013C2F2BA|nr:GNAT family N-acetyltransferase [Allorhizocola rhizosphaerae]
MSIRIEVVDDERWPDLVTLFGPSGAYSGCWCMWWRVPSKEFQANGNAGNRRALESLTRSGEPVGLLAYADAVPVGWAALAPRRAYARILRSPALKPDPGDPGDGAPDAGVWSVPCLFIDRRHRGRGVATALLQAAPKVARKAGARVLEAYPVDTSGEDRKFANAELYTGTVSLMTRLGFTVHKRPPTGRRLVMRRAL